jgi:hypothetical protein
MRVAWAPRSWGSQVDFGSAASSAAQRVPVERKMATATRKHALRKSPADREIRVRKAARVLGERRFCM